MSLDWKLILVTRTARVSRKFLGTRTWASNKWLDGSLRVDPAHTIGGKSIGKFGASTALLILHSFVTRIVSTQVAYYAFDRALSSLPDSHDVTQFSLRCRERLTVTSYKQYLPIPCLPNMQYSPRWRLPSLLFDSHIQRLSLFHFLGEAAQRSIIYIALFGWRLWANTLAVRSADDTYMSRPQALA